MSNYFKLFSCCIPVKGASISIICDIQRSEFHYIPNEMYEILSKDAIKIDELKANYSKKDQKTLQEYLDFFVEKEYGLITKTPESFPQINPIYISPERINNAIVDISTQSDHDFDKIINSLETLGCNFLELRFFSENKIENISNLYLSKLINSRLRSVTVYIKDSCETTRDNIYDSIISKYPIVDKVIVHSSHVSKTEKEIKYRKITYTKTIINSEKKCGIINKKFFTINYSTFFESLKYNSCLNKKLSIDSNGFIKNCPSLAKDFGHHKEKNIVHVATSNEFRELWDLSKNSIDTCKDCQFRYICTDCRAYIEKPNNIYSKPLKCGYDPYTNKWEKWSSLPIKKNAIDKYGNIF